MGKAEYFKAFSSLGTLKSPKENMCTVILIIFIPLETWCIKCAGMTSQWAQTCHQGNCAPRDQYANE